MEKINLTPIRTLYEKIISIEEYYTPQSKWTHLLPDGSDLRKEDVYYRALNMQVPESGGEIQFADNIIEKIVQKCIDAGAMIIQFKCRDKNKELCYPDYKVSELTC